MSLFVYDHCEIAFAGSFENCDALAWTHARIFLRLYSCKLICLRGEFALAGGINKLVCLRGEVFVFLIM